MRTLFVDTALTGRFRYPRDGIPHDPRLQPWITRLAWALDGEDEDSACSLIDVPAVIRIDPEASRVTGIYNHTGLDRRVSLSGAMTQFVEALGDAGLIVAFNWSHQRQVLEHAICYRLGWPARLWPDAGCAMLAATEMAWKNRWETAAQINMTPSLRSASTFMSFETAALDFAGMVLHPEYDPVVEGYRRLVAIRSIWGTHLSRQ